MGIYFIDILFIKKSRGMNNCGQRVLEKKHLFYNVICPSLSILLLKWKVRIWQFYEWKIKSI